MTDGSVVSAPGTTAAELAKTHGVALEVETMKDMSWLGSTLIPPTVATHVVSRHTGVSLALSTGA